MKRPHQKFIWSSVVTMAALLLATPVGAQQLATVILLDRNAIRANVAPNYFPAVEINATIADVGVRDGLPFFSARRGQHLTLPGGTTGHEGWLAFKTIPASWSSAGVTLSGANVGILAFTVVGTSGGNGTTLPSVEVRVLDSLHVCGGDLAPMADAPPAGI